MKKIVYFLLIILLVSLIVAPAVSAAGAVNYVFDETGVLTEKQIAALNEKAAALAEKRECAAYIWIVDLVPEKYARTIDDMEIYADMFYEANGLGYGADRNGMVLLLEIGDVPGERDYLLNTHGSCTSVFHDSARESLLDDKIVPLFAAAFGNGNFYRVADTFLDEAEQRFATYYATRLGLRLAVVILIPVITALVVCTSWKRKMKTAKLARTADNYIPANGFRLTGQTDQFLYRSTTRTKIETDSSGGGGGSSSSSSGRSSGGKI